MKIDKYLNKYARKVYEREDYQWWWNGDQVVAAAISSVARHLRKDGMCAYTEVESAELKTLEKHFAAYAVDTSGLSPEDEWLYAEAMWLLQKWFPRLWD